jgi:hypothetical protein
MIVAANAADPTADEMRVAGILPFHEDAVSPENGGCAVTLDHFAAVEIDFCVYTETTDHARDRIPRHLDEPCPGGAWCSLL